MTLYVFVSHIILRNVFKFKKKKVLLFLVIVFVLIYGDFRFSHTKAFLTHARSPNPVLRNTSIKVGHNYIGIN